MGIEWLNDLIAANGYLNFVLLIIGFVILIKGADLLVDSAAKIAELLGISAFIIGLSVVAFGTSTPEVAVGVFSAMNKANQLSLGNVIGSCIANIALIIGLTATLMPLTVNKPIVKREIPMSLFIQVLLCTLVIVGGVVSGVDGIILLILFAGFLLYIAISSKSQMSQPDILNDSKSYETKVIEEIEVEEKQMITKKSPKTIVKLLTLLIIGLIGLVWGGDIVVDSASNIARMFGVGETLIGLTIVSIGTTLPEMVATLSATFRKQSDIAVGNIIGSNIFNILCVLGVSVSINPIANLSIFSLPQGLVVDMAVMLTATIILFGITARYKRVNRTAGIFFLTYYAAYLVFKIVVSA